MAKVTDRISVTIPRGPERGDPNYFVGINGKNYLLPKGKMSDVPPEVAEEVARATEAENLMYDRKDAMKNKA